MHETPEDAHRRVRGSGLSLSRRMVVRGAAWAVPAVSAAVLAPSARASGRTLAFTAAAFTGEVCGEITSAVVQCLDGSVPVAGVAVALQLSGAYTFGDATTSAVVITASDGTAAVGTIRVPASGQTGSLTATAASASAASALLSATSRDVLLFSPRGSSPVTTVPSGAVAVAADLFLSGGSLYRSGAGAVVRDVSAVGALAPDPAGSGALLLPIGLADGTSVVWNATTATVSAVAGVPASATPVAADLFLSGTTISRNGVAVAGDVAAYGQLVEHEQGAGPTGQFEVPYRSTTGAPRLLRVPAGEVRTAAEFGSAGGPPANATPVAGDLFAANGSLYRVSWDGSNPYGTGVVATDVAAWGALTPNPFFQGQRLLPVVTSSGTPGLFMVSGNTVRAVTQVPTGATPVGADLFSSGGRIYQDGVGAVAENVVAVGQPAPVSVGSSRVVVPLSTQPATC